MGTNHSCAIETGSGAVVCWGDHSFGLRTPPPSVDGTDGTARAIAAGAHHNCAIQAGSNAVVCWGTNSYGQSLPPATVNGTFGTATAIAAGEFHSCAIRSGSAGVVCWGRSDDSYGATTPPPSVDGTTGTATAIAVGLLHSCAIQAGSGAVVCWGSNYDPSGGFYIGQATPPTWPNGAGFVATAISAGGYHSLAIRQATPLQRGDLLVTDQFGGRVVRIDNSGAVDTFSPPPGASSFLHRPAGIVVAPDGYVYVVDSDDEWLVRIDHRTGAQQVVPATGLVYANPPPTRVGDQPWGLDGLEDVPGVQHLFVSASTGLHEAIGQLTNDTFQGNLVDGTLPATHFGVAVRSDGTALDSVWVAAGSDGLWVWDAERRSATRAVPPSAGEWFLDVDFPRGQLEVPFFTRVQEAGFGGCAAGTGGVFTAGEGAVVALSQGGLLRCPFSLAYVPERGEIYVADAASVLLGGAGQVVRLQGSGFNWQQSLFVDAETLGVSLPAGIAYVHQLISGCPGDCDGDDEVGVDELILGANIALGSAAMDQCAAFDVNDDLQMTIDELVLGVESLLNGCP